ncbi:MAG: MBL fold metallo-hydrolase [Patescibacteria group bacterium]|nr:MBL fold metallo-hydrolase [Patescibacteria group bacterium]
MIIELTGLSGVKIQSGDNIILFAPPSAKSELRSSRAKADVAVLGKPGDVINVEPRGEKLFTVDGPGEFEAGGIFVYCLPSPALGPAHSLLSRTAIEGMAIVHLGGLNTDLSARELELFEGADILLVPVGGKDVLDAKAAKAIVEKIEPRVVIPMHASQKGVTTAYDDAQKFFKEMGASPQPQERAKLVKKDLPMDTMEVLHIIP